MSIHGQSQQTYWLKKVVLLRKHGAEPNVDGPLRDPQACFGLGHSQATSHWEVSMLEFPFRLVGREKIMMFIDRKDLFLLKFHMPQAAQWFMDSLKTSLRWCKCICRRVGNLKTRLHVLFLFTQKQGNYPVVQAVPRVQLLKWTSALVTRTKICGTTPWRPRKNPKARQMVLIGLCFSWLPRCTGEVIYTRGSTEGDSQNAT